MTKMLQNDKNLTGSQEQQEKNQKAVETTARHSDRTVETCSCTTEMQNTLLAHLGASTLSSGDVMSLSFAVSLAGLENSSGTMVAIGLLTIIQDTDFEA